MDTNPSKTQGDNLPVDRVTWNRIQEFVSKLISSAKLPAHWRARLLSEAQWGYGCRVGSTVEYGGVTLNDVAWYSANSGDQIHPVGTKRANAWGLFDMLGNAFEFCDDRYGELVQGGLNPQGPSQGDTRVFRGGCYSSRGGACREARRSRLSPDQAFSGLGFRLVLESVP